jgi:hypothetical protein
MDTSSSIKSEQPSPHTDQKPMDVDSGSSIQKEEAARRLLVRRGEQSFVLDPPHPPIYSPVCSFCAYLDADGNPVCEAFPGGIPNEIWSGTNQHTEAFPGDNGLRFMQNP